MRKVSFLALAIGLACLSFTAPASAQYGYGTPFAGTWCVQGDPNKRGSIFGSANNLTLVNDSGSQSTGQMNGSRSINAMNWNVSGELSNDGNRINWTNSSFWVRCGGNGNGGNYNGGNYNGGNSNGGGPVFGHGPQYGGNNAGGNYGMTAALGRWYAAGDRSRQCSIMRQGGEKLTFVNESGVTATGRFLGGNRVEAFWYGQRTIGTIGQRGNLNWSNGTYWTR